MKKTLFILLLISMNLMYGQEVKTMIDPDETDLILQDPIQIGLNVLTLTEYLNIQVCGVNLKDIIESKGEPTSIENLFGVPISMNIDPDGDFNHYTYPGFTLGFSAVINVEMGLSGFKITDSNCSILIKGISLKLGDSISKLGNVKFNLDTNGDYSILFVPVENSNQYIAIDYNQTTKLITKIYLIELT